MKKLYLILASFLISAHITAQDWSFCYTGDYPQGSTQFCDGFIDEDGVTFLAGREGPDYDHPEALFMRIEPDGSHSEFKYKKEGCLSKATCILEMANHNLFVAGNISDSLDDFVMVLILDKQLNLLEEHSYEKEVEALSFGDCKAVLDSHGNIIVSTTVLQDYNPHVTTDHGVFLKFDCHGDLISCRYLIEDYPGALYFFTNFHLRQMWYNEEDETLLCLAPASNNIMSFVTFDSAFNYLREYPIINDENLRFDHILNDDCFTDHWYNDEELLVFNSRGDYEHNDLRIAKINVYGDFLDYIFLTETPDTIFDPALYRSMATANDSVIYYSFYYHLSPLRPGQAVVWMLNEQLEIIGSYAFDDCSNYRADLILPTSDDGCLVVNHLSPDIPMDYYGSPIITKLKKEDFTTVLQSIAEPSAQPPPGLAYPNPTDATLCIPLPELRGACARCQIMDAKGLVISDRIVNSDERILQLEVSGLSPGIYLYRIYTTEKTLLTEKFIKK